jgi:hypothetical protein
MGAQQTPQFPWQARIGWLVRDTNGPLGIQIIRDGVEVEWSFRLTPHQDI